MPKLVNFITLKHTPEAQYTVQYNPSYDIYEVKRRYDQEIVLRTSYRSEAMLYVGVHTVQ